MKCLSNVCPHQVPRELGQQEFLYLSCFRHNTVQFKCPGLPAPSLPGLPWHARFIRRPLKIIAIALRNPTADSLGYLSHHEYRVGCFNGSRWLDNVPSFLEGDSRSSLYKSASRTRKIHLQESTGGSWTIDYVVTNASFGLLKSLLSEYSTLDSVKLVRNLG